MLDTLGELSRRRQVLSAHIKRRDSYGVPSRWRQVLSAHIKRRDPYGVPILSANSPGGVKSCLLISRDVTPTEFPIKRRDPYGVPISRDVTPTEFHRWRQVLSAHIKRRDPYGVPNSFQGNRVNPSRRGAPPRFAEANGLIHHSLGQRPRTFGEWHAR